MVTMYVHTCFGAKMAVGPHVLTGELKGTHVCIPNLSACIYHTQDRHPPCRHRHRNGICTEGLPFTKTTTDFLASVHTTLYRDLATFLGFSLGKKNIHCTRLEGCMQSSRCCLQCHRIPHLTYSKARQRSCHVQLCIVAHRPDFVGTVPI